MEVRTGAEFAGVSQVSSRLRRIDSKTIEQLKIYEIQSMSSGRHCTVKYKLLEMADLRFG